MNNINYLISEIYEAIVFHDKEYNKEWKRIEKPLIAQEDLKHLYIAGGALVNTLRGKSHIKDFDIFFDDETILNKYIPILEKRSPHQYIKTDFSYTCYDNRLSFVYKYVGEPEKIIQQFDWKHCQVYSYITNEKGDPLENVEPVMNGLTKDCILKGNLRAHHIKYPTISLMRAIKKIKNGWHINEDSWEFLMKNCMNVPIKDVEYSINHSNS